MRIEKEHLFIRTSTQLCSCLVTSVILESRQDALAKMAQTPVLAIVAPPQVGQTLAALGPTHLPAAQPVPAAIAGASSQVGALHTASGAAPLDSKQKSPRFPGGSARLLQFTGKLDLATHIAYDTEGETAAQELSPECGSLQGRSMGQDQGKQRRPPCYGPPGCRCSL